MAHRMANQGDAQQLKAMLDRLPSSLALESRKTSPASEPHLESEMTGLLPPGTGGALHTAAAPLIEQHEFVVDSDPTLRHLATDSPASRAQSALVGDTAPLLAANHDELGCPGVE